MRRSLLAVISVAAFVFSACTSGGGATPGAASPAASTPAESASASPAFDPASISGTVVFSGWQASEEEGAALEETLAAFKTAYPNITVDYQPVLFAVNIFADDHEIALAPAQNLL